MRFSSLSFACFDYPQQAEGFFAAANIFSALKLVHLFSINPHLGPLQISLGRMVIDIVKFLIIYTLVLFAFACGELYNVHTHNFSQFIIYRARALLCRYKWKKTIITRTIYFLFNLIHIRHWHRTHNNTVLRSQSITVVLCGSREGKVL